MPGNVDPEGKQQVTTVPTLRITKILFVAGAAASRVKARPAAPRAQVWIIGWYSSAVRPNVHATPSRAVRVRGGTRNQ